MYLMEQKALRLKYRQESFNANPIPYDSEALAMAPHCIPSFKATVRYWNK